MEMVNACIDIPSENDFIYEEVFGGVEEVFGATLINKRTPVQDQSIPRTPSTGYGCTCFSLSHIINEENAIESEGANTPILVSTLGEELWKEALTLGAQENVGWSLQGILNLSVKKNLISGYARVIGLNAIKASINANRLISTGANCIDWNSTRANNSIAIFGPINYGHAFCIVGFDDERQVLVCKNSYGTQAFDGGYFYVRYEDIGKLYSTYSVVDYVNGKEIKEYKEKKKLEDELNSIKRIIELGITNGENRSSTPTRYELMLMMERLVKLIEQKLILK